MKQVAAVKGVGIGSTMIDRAFELLFQRRMDEYEEARLPEDLAHKLARNSSFLSIKHNFGTKAATQPIYKLPLNRLGLRVSPDSTHAGLRVEGGKILFTKYVICDVGSEILMIFTERSFRVCLIYRLRGSSSRSMNS